MDSRVKWFAIISIFAMLGVASLNALQETSKQEPSKQEPAKPGSNPPFKLSVATNLVVVPVIVTDKRGSHIPGLTVADFEVKEDGKSQSIVRLDELTAESSKIEPPQAPARTFTNQLREERPKKLEIIALDQINTPFASARDGSRALVEFLSKNVDANTLLALVSLEHNGVRIIHNFTSDPSVLVAAVKKVQVRLTSQDTRSMDVSGENSQADMEALQLNAILSGTSPDLSNVNTSNPGNVAAAQSRASMAQMRAQVDLARRGQDAIITLEDMQQVAQYFGGVPGRKSLLWISAGFPFALGSAATSNTKGVLFEDWERTVRALADANVAVYPVDVTGLLPGVNANNLAALDSTVIRAGGAEGGVAARSKQLEAVDTGAFADPNMARQETMRQLADMTGGQAFYNANNTVDLLRRAAEDSGRYYLLAYYTKDTGKAGWRKLNVKVDRDGAKIRARSGYFFHSAAGDTEANRQAEEMMAMQSDLNFSSIPIRGQWQQIETTGNDRKVRFLLSIPAGVPYIDAEHENHISYDFRVIVTNSSGVAVSRNGQRLDTNLAALDVTQIRSSGLDYANEVVLPPGQYTVHFVVRDNLRGALGSVVTPLKVD